MSGEQHANISGNVEKSIFTSGDHNLTVLGNIIVYPASHEQAPEQPAAAPEIGPNPYKGLSAFHERDHERFFGRDVLIKELHAEFAALHATAPGTPNPTRLLAVLGPSGSGKSSVVRAGLLPELARQPLPGLRETRIAVLTPGNHPLEALANSLARMAFDDVIPVEKSREFKRVLRNANEQGQWDGLRCIARAMPWIHAAALILVVDQCEEIYTLCEDSKERQCFINNLLHAAADSATPVSVIITLRSDFLGHTQRHPEFNHGIAANGTIVHVMTAAELREAIAKPAELAGHPLDDATIDLLIQQSKEREGALPLLQFALSQIWDGMAGGRQPAETLRKIGGVGGALANKAEELYAQLDEHGRAMARRAFLAMVRLGEGTQDTRRRASIAEIVAQGEEQEQVHGVLQHFSSIDARLITLSTVPEAQEVISEITHESLFDHWETLQHWLDNSRDDVRFHRRLAEAANHWDEQGRPEGLLWRPPDLDLLRPFHQRAGQDMTPLQMEFFEASVRKEEHSRRVRQFAITALVLLVVIATCAAGVAFWAYKEANEQKAAAERQSRISLIRSVVAYAYKEDAQKNRECAALLVRQASFLNRRFDGNVDDQIEDALHTIFRTSAIVEGPGHAVTGAELLDLVCRNVNIKKVLESEEWVKFVGDDIEHKPACPQLLGAQRLQLRSEKMTTTTDMEALSLNLREDGGYGYPIEYITNDFEDLGDVIIDHATGLMWQKSGSKERLTYAKAEEYIKKLNREKFGGYADWRLPTVEELLSLLEKERNSDGQYIDSMFDAQKPHVWSSDLRQIKGENSSRSAWLVHFLNGFVNRDLLNFSSYVRVVRSRQ